METCRCIRVPAFLVDKYHLSGSGLKTFGGGLAISKDMNVNEKIRAREVRLIDANGDQLGVKTRTEALEIAETRELGLVMVAPGAKGPGCSIMNHGKYGYEKQKKDHEDSKTEKTTQV